jgi:putative thioredoxin
MSQYAADVSEQNFAELVLKGSQGRLVLVDFWAPWCAPCRVLKPMLEKLADELLGRFFLAKVNSDENPNLATQYAVRGIPTVKAIIDGRVVDEFSGALPESYVREFIERNAPSPVTVLLARSREALAAGNITGAAELLDQVLTLDPANGAARVERATLCLDDGRLAEAAALVEGLRGDILDYQHTQRLLARLSFARRLDAAPSEQQLIEAIARGDTDPDKRLLLAAWRVAAGEFDEAMAQLLEVLRSAPRHGDGIARTQMLAVFDIVGPEDPLVQKYRRLMASALH